MRFLLVIVGALMLVGLAAFGVLSAQKVATPASEPPPRLASLSPAIPASPTAAPVTTRDPVNQVMRFPLLSRRPRRSHPSSRAGSRRQRRLRLLRGPALKLPHLRRRASPRARSQLRRATSRAA